MKDIDELKEMLHTLRVCDENSFIELGDGNPNSMAAIRRIRLTATPGGLKYGLKELRFMGYANVEGGGIYFENDDKGINLIIEKMVLQRAKSREINPLIQPGKFYDQLSLEKEKMDWFLHFNTKPEDVGVGAMIKQRIADAQTRGEV